MNKISGHIWADLPDTSFPGLHHLGCRIRELPKTHPESKPRYAAFRNDTIVVQGASVGSVMAKLQVRQRRRLASQAPELLEGCRMALETLERWGESGEPGLETCESEPLIGYLREAISRCEL